MEAKIEEVREALGLLDNVNQQIADICKGLAQKPVDDNAAENLIHSVFPNPFKKPENDEEEKISTRLQNIRALVYNNFQTMDTEATVGTAYGILNAITQYVDHQQTNKGPYTYIKAGNSFESVFFGKGFSIKQRALKLLNEMS